MGVLKIKVNNTGKSTDWEEIDNLNLTNLNISNTATFQQDVEITGDLIIGTSTNPKEITLNGKDLGEIIENSAITVYIHVNSDGTYYTSEEPKVTDARLTLMQWFNKAYPINTESRNRVIKGFLIEHRTIGSTTYHLPYYWNNSSWVLLNAIWG